MFVKLIKHSWLAFRRAHYFEKSLGINLLKGFVVIILMFYLLMAGMGLPGILQDVAPNHKAHEIIFSGLIFIFMADLLTRYFIQNIPAQKISPYLHYPVSKNSIASFFITRAWFNIFNVFPLIFFMPFFAFSIIPNISHQAFWNIIVGVLVLSGLNHSLIFYLNSFSGVRYTTTIILILLITGFIAFSWFYTGMVLDFSLWMGNKFMYGSTEVFLVLIAIIIIMQFLAKRNLTKGFYHLLESGKETRISQKPTFAEKFFLKIPVFGKYWDLEWKLIMRNKRTKNNLYQYPLILPLVVIILSGDLAENVFYIAFLMLFIGSYGFYHLQFFLSWESRFFDYLASRKICFADFFKAKYYFYNILALFQFIILLPFLFYLNPFSIFVYISIMVYCIGVAFCIMMLTGIYHSTRIKPNQSSFMNFEGVSGTQFIMVFLILFTLIPVLAAGYIINDQYGVYLAMFATGFATWALHPLWIKKVSESFMKRKYSKLEKYRKN